MKNIISILALAYLLSMITVSASETEIISPVANQKYYIWDEVPIELKNPEEGYIYTSFVNGIPTDVFAPNRAGKYVIKVLGENPDCGGCADFSAEQIFKIGYYPRIEKTQIEIISPASGVTYHVGDVVPIEFKSPLTDRDDFIFETYVTGPDRVSKPTEIWAPTSPGKYGIRVDAIGTECGLTFTSSLGYVVQAPE